MLSTCQRGMIYKYALLYYKMTNQYRLTDPTKATLFLDITSGGVGLTVWRGESLLFQRNMHSGSLRVMESFNRNQRSSTSFPMAITEYLHRMIGPLREELQTFNINSVILSGDEAQYMARLMGDEVIRTILLLLNLNDLKPH